MSWQLVVFDGALQENFYFDKEQRSCRLCSAQKASTHTRVVHADLFADGHRCGYPYYPTYVGCSAIYADNADIDEDIRIRGATPVIHKTQIKDRGLSLA